jgi:O-acetyl-ADP-ribose deacetylase (regulator of RNase III)
MTIKLIEGDITESNSDVIVNAADTELSAGGGVAAAIRAKFGENAFIQDKKLELGELVVKELKLENNPANFIFHVVTIDWDTDTKINVRELESSIMKCFRNLEQLDQRSIAFPLLATGSVGMGKESVRDLIQQIAIRSQLSSNYLVEIYTHDTHNSN